MLNKDNNKYNILTPQPQYLTSRKKFRGQKRYYRHLNQEIDSWLNSLTEADFSKSRNVHADFYGYGNLGGRHRISHLKVFCRIFRHLASRIDDRKDCQILLQLNAKQDSALDTLYFNIIGDPESPHYDPSSPGYQTCKDAFLYQFLQPELSPNRLDIKVFEGNFGIRYYITLASKQQPI